MTRIRFINDNYFRSGTIIEVTSEAAQFSVENVQDDVKTLVWRTNTGDIEDEHIILDNGSEKEYDFIALLNHNLTADATITLKGADDAAITSNVVSDTIVRTGTNIYQFLTTARTKRYIQLIVDDDANPSNYIQIGVVVVGKYWEPNRNYSAYSDGPLDETEIETSPGGAMFVTQDRRMRRVWLLPFNGLDDTTETNLRAMLNLNGIAKAMIINTNTAAMAMATHWVRLRELVQPFKQHLNFWTWEAEFEEVL